MSDIFRFKQFSVDQTSCAMKINTDGVLLGALADADNPATILDIGTGTGVIALMLAQRFLDAKIDAVEIDKEAAQTAGKNFSNSAFGDRLNVYPVGFQDFFKDHREKKYDLIISNSPFHLNSLESPDAAKSIAKHTGENFFRELICGAAKHLAETGSCWLILPTQAAKLVIELVMGHGLTLQKNIAIFSFEDSEPHREVLVIGRAAKKLLTDKFVIYSEPKTYSEKYKKVLKDYLTIF